MVVQCLFSESTSNDLLESQEKEKDLYELNETIDIARRNGAGFFSNDKLYNVQSNGKAFYDWIYSRDDDPNLYDLKKELLIRMEKSITIDDDECDVKMAKIINSDIDKELMVSFGKERNGLFIWTEDDYWAKKQWFLKTKVDRCDFCFEVSECFPHLFFHDSIKHSMNTLENDYNIEKEHIIYHLAALDGFYEGFKHLRGKSFREQSDAFTRETAIECSPQSNREEVKKLKFTFKTIQQTEKMLVCEMHTKLKWKNFNLQKQDRIYFHPGDEEIENGKILIVHIGRHL